MNFDSAKLLHIGVSYVVAPVSEINEEKAHEFAGHLIKAKLGLNDRKFESGTIIALRRTPTPLEVKIAFVGPQLAQILVVAPHPRRAFEIFVEETQEVVAAFAETWMQGNFQIIHSDATIRQLYDSTRDHGFSELWEDKLGQHKESLAIFDRPVQGGGLRFVMPERPGEKDRKRVELKIESFIRDPKQIFVEVQFGWVDPVIATSVADFRIADRLKNLEGFIENKVHKFMERA